MAKPKCEVGVEVHAYCNPRQTGVIVEVTGPYQGIVRWADGSSTEEHMHALTDVDTKRRAAKRAAERYGLLDG